MHDFIWFVNDDRWTDRSCLIFSCLIYSAITPFSRGWFLFCFHARRILINFFCRVVDLLFDEGGEVGERSQKIFGDTLDDDEEDEEKLHKE